MPVGTIGIIGAGTMGSGIAQVCAAAGLSVSIMDVSDVALEKSLSAIAQNLDRLVRKGKLKAADKEAALARIKRSTSYDALAPWDLVIEAATENLELKQKILSRSIHSSGLTPSWPQTPPLSRSRSSRRRSLVPIASSACISSIRSQ